MEFGGLGFFEGKGMLVEMKLLGKGGFLYGDSFILGRGWKRWRKEITELSKGENLGEGKGNVREWDLDEEVIG